MRIVSDKQIRSLLSDLSPSDIHKFQQVLRDALQRYNADPTLIPERIVVKRDELECIHLFMPTFTGENVGVKTLGGSREGFKGAVMIIDEKNGDLQGVLNAMTLTAFRTALASSIPLMKFFDQKKKDQTITVFGNGLQAYWHVALTLRLFPSHFKNVQIVVRSKNEKSQELYNTLSQEFKDVAFTLLDADYDLSTSTVIYGCVPSTDPAIKLASLSQSHKTYISIIGSYKPHMFEVDDGIVQEALNHGKVIVDSFEHTLHEAGELIKNSVTPDQCVEIGKLEKFANGEINTSEKLVLVKIVGLAIMDISVGSEILKQCEAAGLGSLVEF